MGPSLHFEDVGLWLGGGSILEHIDFAVEAGTIHCLIGPNGGGKTSLLRSLLGQMPHTGTIRIRWGRARTIGYVPQALDFDRTLPMTVEDFLAMTCQHRPAFLGLGRRHRAEVAEALDRVGMSGKRKRLFGALSGGERQRVLLAQALIPRPRLLILDEPATGLDREGDELVRSFCREFRDEGATVLVIHHDLSVVRELGDAVTCVNRRVLFSGPPESELTPDRVFSIFSSAKAA